LDCGRTSFEVDRARRFAAIRGTSYLQTVTAISERDTAALLEVVHNGASEVGREPFPASVLRALALLIPSDAYVGYQEVDVAGSLRVVDLLEVEGEPASPAMEAAFEALGWQNPMHCRVHAEEDVVLRLSDLLSRRERRALEYNVIVWKPLGIDDALRLWLPAERGRSRSIYLERSGRNYSNRELTLFSLLRPHLIRMQRNADFRRRLDRHKGLTSREAEVLGWIAHGSTNHEIASTLFISPHTVRKHIENIFAKLEVRTRTAAALHARQRPIPN
jgi:DNA-binding CsgD family transcriptional regulator